MGIVLLPAAARDDRADRVALLEDELRLGELGAGSGLVDALFARPERGGCGLFVCERSVREDFA